MGYAFISYSTQNKGAAEAIQHLFAKHNIETWMAPNDIPVGSRYAEVINKAVKDCACLVLLLTDASQNSTWVAKEVERAIHYKKVIIPVQLEDVVLNDEFEFYISTDQLVFVKKLEDGADEIKQILAGVSACVKQGPQKPAAANASTETKRAVSESQPGKNEESELDPWECYRLGYAYEFGVDRPIDYKEAVNWYLKAAKHENSWSQNRLGDCYRMGHGVPKDLCTAVKWYTRAAENGDHTAQYTLGFCYEFGQGVAVDYSRAAYWYEKAAEQGHSWAQHRLGACYYYGRGVDQNPEKAFAWLKQAADQNNDGVYALLAQCYENGFGVEKNAELAHYWRTKKN